LQHANIIGHIAGMKMFRLALCVAILAPLHADDVVPAKPGFWKRTFQKTKDGVGTVWDGTKSVGKKAAGVVTAPFGKKGSKDAATAIALQNLVMTMKIEPAQIRLPDTRMIEVTVSVVNNGKTAVHLEFPTSLRVDVLVKDERGKLLSRWSDDQPIEREPGLLLINPRERLEYSAKISTREMAAGRPFEIEAFYPSYEKLRVVRSVVPQR
jgi:Intracellular proteinase inhibitor